MPAGAGTEGAAPPSRGGTFSVDEARFRYQKLRDKVEDLKRRKQEAREAYGKYYRNEIRLAQLTALAMIGLLVAWVSGQPVGEFLGGLLVGYLFLFWYLVGFGKRKIRALAREITATEELVRQAQDGP